MMISGPKGIVMRQRVIEVLLGVSIAIKQERES